MAALKSFSDNFNISGILVLVIGNCLFSIQDGIFPVLGITSDFQLAFGCFGYSVTRVWIVFKPSMLAAFLWHCSRREKGCLPHSCQVRVEVQVPHLAPTDTTWLAWWGLSCYSSPCILHWQCLRGGESPDSTQGILWHHPSEEWEEFFIILARVDVCSDTEGGGSWYPDSGCNSQLITWPFVVHSGRVFVASQYSLERMGGRPFMWALLVGLAYGYNFFWCLAKVHQWFPKSFLYQTSPFLVFWQETGNYREKLLWFVPVNTSGLPVFSAPYLRHISQRKKKKKQEKLENSSSFFLGPQFLSLPSCLYL